MKVKQQACVYTVHVDEVNLVPGDVQNTSNYNINVVDMH